MAQKLVAFAPYIKNKQLTNMSKKTYIIVGDNNFWYSFSDCTLSQAKKELRQIRKKIAKGVGSEFDEPSEASVLYLFEAKEIESVEVDN